MARALRIQYPGAWFHLTARAIERRPLFRDDRDRHHFLELLPEAVERYRLRLCAYVLMDNHYHLLLQICDANLSVAMQWLGDSYAMWFNRRHRRVGPLYQGRFKAVLVDGESYAVEVSRYLHLNPVRTKPQGLDKKHHAASRAGIVEKPPDPQQLAVRLRRLREERWSSYRAYVGLASAPGWLDDGTILAMMGGRPGAEQRRAYQRYVEEAVREGLPESPWERLVGGMVLGGPAFVRQVRRWIRGNAREQPALRPLSDRPRFEQAVAVVAALKRERWEKFRDRHGDWGRDLVIHLARRHCGLTLREIGERVGGTHYAAVAMGGRRLAARTATDRPLRQLVKQAEAQMLNVKT